MAIKAELPDGTILEFPEGTPDDVIDAAVKNQISSGQPTDQSFLRGLYLGAREPIDVLASRLEQMPGIQGINRLGAALGLPTAQQTLAETDIQRRQNKSGAGQLIGNIAGTAAVLPTRAVTAPVTLGQAALGGGLSSALLSRAQNLTDFASDVGAGTAFGAVTQPIAALGSQVIAPKISKEMQTLIKEGISPTIGMIGRDIGGLFGEKIIGKTEEALTSLWGLGDIIESARSSVGKEFGKAALNRAASFANSIVPENLQDDAAVSFIKTKLSEGYKKLVPSLKFDVTPEFISDAKDIFKSLNIPSDKKNVAKGWGAIIKDNILDAANKSAEIVGDNLQSVLSNLGDLSRTYMKSSDAWERRLGVGAAKLRSKWMEALAQQNPQQAAELSRLNSGWSNVSVLQKAVSGADGKITPTTLDRAVKAFGGGVRKGSYVDLARAGRSIKGTLSDSGTVARLVRNVGGIGAFGYGANEIAQNMGYEGITPQQASAIALIAAPYSPQGRKAIAAIMGRQPGVVSKAAANAFRRAISPAAAAGLITLRQGNR
jgi:hypothetical protein